MRWVVLSDLHERIALLPLLATALRDADVVVLSGDLTMFGGRREAARVVDAVRAHARRVLAVPGNTDHPEVLEYLEHEGLSLHGRAVRVGPVVFYGAGGSSPTPFSTPFELEEGALADVLAAGHACAEAETDAAACVLVSHCPPLASGVDRLWTGRPVGSTAVRAHVAERRPALVHVGHIHEARGLGAVDGVVCANPGPFGAGGYAVAELDGDGRVTATLASVPRSRGQRAAEGVAALAHKVARLPRRHRTNG